MNTDWYKDYDPRLERLASLLGMGKTPSHGYTVAENKPEIVTAPGVYYPATEGEVIPLEPRQYGGSVFSVAGADFDINRIKNEPTSFADSLTVNPTFNPLEEEKAKANLMNTLQSAMQTGTPPSRNYYDVHPEEKETGFKPSLPLPPKPPTQQNYGIQPRAKKGGSFTPRTEGDLLWKRKQKEAQRQYGTEPLPLYSRQEGGDVTPGLLEKAHENSKIKTLQKAINQITSGVLLLANKDTEESNTTIPFISKANPPGDVIPPAIEDEDEKERRKILAMNPDLRKNIRFGEGMTEEEKKWAKEPSFEHLASYVPTASEKMGGYNEIYPSGEKVFRPEGYKRYYDVHPEEEMMDLAKQEKKPLMDMYKKLIEENTARSQGYGLGFEGKERQKRQALANIPHLTSDLEKLMEKEIETPEKYYSAEMKGGKTPTPHWVRDEEGNWKGLLPGGGVIHSGVRSKEITGIPGFREWSNIPENKGKTYEDYRKWEVGLRESDTATTKLREFETVTGIDPNKRGTPEYKKSFLDYMQSQKDIVDPMRQKVLGANLRKEFNALQPVKDYRDTKIRVDIMEAALALSKTTKNFVGVDQAMINLFNKIPDPRSVVRESEYARTGQNMPVVDSIIGKMQKWIAGGAGLTNAEREALVEISREFRNKYTQNYRKLFHEYRGYAKDYGLDPDTVLKAEQKKIVQKYESKSTGKIKYVYDDGTEEII